MASNDGPVNPHGEFVLYWMVASRRPFSNFGLERAVEWARQLDRPLLILEALRAAYPWASDRFHVFVLEGMRDNARTFAKRSARYHPYVERRPGDGRGLVAALSRRAAVVVTDAFPAFFLPRMLAAAQVRSPVRFEQVDSTGLLPLEAAERSFATAFAFRAFLQRQLRSHLECFPAADPLDGVELPPLVELPPELSSQWPCVDARALASPARWVAELPLDHSVPPVPLLEGGHLAAARTLTEFVSRDLSRYGQARQADDLPVASGLSPYLHFGHVSAHQVFAEVMSRERWTTRSLAASGRGQREGWWGVSAPAEAFLDELITWRELGYATSHRRADYDQYESLPAWARATLDRHAGDERTHLYSLAEFERASTHDRLWNAAQVQLLREGRIHNYLRMLWGKKILEWSASPREALAVMIELNNKHALDGRDPNSYSGIFWVLGRYDRPWAPERPVFGTVRYMSSTNTARKLRVRGYLTRYQPAGQGILFDEPEGSG